MNPRAWGFLSFVIIGLTFMAALTTVDSKAYLYASGLNAVFQGSMFVSRSIPGTGLSAFVPNPDFFTGLFSLITWNYPWLQGQWDIFRLFVLTPITAFALWGVITTLTPVGGAV